MKNSIETAIRVTFIFLITVGGCSNSDSQNNDGFKGTVEGYIQKGPFVSGSSITIQEIDRGLNPTGKTFGTVTNDDFGSFSTRSELDTSYAEIIAQGFYHNEVSGELSDANLTLRSFSSLTGSSETNVNILTTLTRDRVNYLVNNEELDFNSANEKAKEELLGIFGISSESVSNFDEMDISESGDSNAILLAISAILQGENTVAELSERMSKISLDIRKDGVIDNNELITEITNSSKSLSLPKVRLNLIDRYESLGLSVTIPDFEEYVDSDGDGTINSLDDDTLIWNTLNAAAPWQARHYHCMLEFDDRMWIIGGVYRSDSGEERYLSDVWKSDNGVNWTIVAETAPWQPRAYHACVVFDGKMWLIGGREDRYVNGNAVGSIGYSDAWYSENGKEWELATDTVIDSSLLDHFAAVVFQDKIWVLSDDDGGEDGEREIFYSEDGKTWSAVTDTGLPSFSESEHAAVVFDDKIWIAGGSAGGAGESNMVWYSEDGVIWNEITDPRPWTARISHVLTVLNGKMWLFGGRSVGGSWVYEDDNIMWFSTDGMTWSSYQGNVSIPNLFGTACISTNQEIICSGGLATTYVSDTEQGQIKGKITNEVWRFGDYTDVYDN